ncbi:lipoyl(octanoyl) transferase LipB [Buchnera aphidicola]|uniref:lipoyl(octanoyl) transferase LipB n=1 Tax=Buchnera aphidicola TaxID=9 RepID=UPI003464673C
MKKIYIRNLGITDWNQTFSAMHRFTELRSEKTIDELWFTEHYSIFTKGLSENNKNIIKKCFNIPVVKSDRGGKITYHGPGQQLVYILINLKLSKIKIQNFIFFIEKIVIQTLNFFSIFAYNVPKSPGVYINKKKFCSIGLRIKKNCSLHGIAFNINTNLKYYKYIYPCGNKFVKMINLNEINSEITMDIFREKFIDFFLKIFKYKAAVYKSSYNIFDEIGIY